MSRKTRREQQFDREILKTAFDLKDHVDVTEGLSEDEIKELAEYMEFHNRMLKHARDTAQIINVGVLCHALSPDTMVKYKYFCRSSHQQHAKILTLLSVEAEKKGFESLLTYVRFLKLTHFEEDGEFRVSSENEQLQIKRWVHMKRHFMMKRDIGIEMATPKSNHVWIVPES